MQATRGKSQPGVQHDHSMRTHHARLTGQGRNVQRAYPTEEVVRRRAQYEQRRMRRQILRQREETSRRNETRAFVIVMSGFLCGSVALSVMFRLGESMLSSIVYGVMLGIAVNLVFLIAVAALDWYDGAYAYDYDYFDDDDDQCDEADDDDFAGLGNGVDASDMFRQNREEPYKTSASVSLYRRSQRHMMPKLLGNRSQRDMKSFLDTLSSDLEPEQADVIIH